MQLRFFYPILRTDVTTWVKGCAQISWPVKIPLYIMRVYIWDPGTALSNSSADFHLLNDMCDLTQFFVYTITTETHAEHIILFFMENVVLSFGMVVIIVVGADSRFKSFFKDMCTALGIVYLSLECGNHKGTRIEKYHQFLNRTQAITGQYRGTQNVFLQKAKTSQ